MNLTDLGWTPFFSNTFEEFNEEGCVPARVALEHRNGYRLYTEHGEMAAEISGRLRHRAAGPGELPAVGDWVAVMPLEEEERGIIQHVLPRRSRFSRKVAGSRTEEQIVAANIDTVFIVVGLDANYNPRRVERALILAWESGASPAVVLNKADLCDDLSTFIEEMEAVALGVPVIPISAAEERGLDALARFFTRGSTVALIGSSGVGKSTIINRLVGAEVQDTGGVSDQVGKGKHTTTHRELILLPTGGLIMDTPGMRELQLWHGEEGLQETFEDIEALVEECRFRDCRHNNEPGCAVARAIADGALDRKRFENYRKMQREIAYQSRREDHNAMRAERERWKVVTKEMRRREHKRS